MKPRDKGITMVIDKGIGLRAQNDLIESAGEFMDLAKIVTCLSGIYPEDHLRKKIELYQNHQIEVFPGGMFLELAIMQGKTKEYFEDAEQAGYKTVEVSDNIVEITPEEKSHLISIAADEYGFKILGEVGKKYASTSPQAIIKDIQNCLNAGAWRVFVEAMELFTEELNTEIIDQIAEIIPIEKLILELPLLEYRGVHRYDVNEIQSWLITHFGPDVNIGNVDTCNLLTLEQLRRGLFPGTFGKMSEPNQHGNIGTDS
jgi:phosphosulfolactate synthase